MKTGVSNTKSLSQTSNDSEEELEKISPITPAADKGKKSSSVKERTKKNLNTSLGDNLPKTSEFLKVKATVLLHCFACFRVAFL